MTPRTLDTEGFSGVVVPFTRCHPGQPRPSLLVVVADDCTRLIQSEEFSGAMVPFTAKVLARTEAGFVAMNEALRVRAEAASRR